MISNTLEKLGHFWILSQRGTDITTHIERLIEDVYNDLSCLEKIAKTIDIVYRKLYTIGVSCLFK